MRSLRAKISNELQASVAHAACRCKGGLCSDLRSALASTATTDGGPQSGARLPVGRERMAPRRKRRHVQGREDGQIGCSAQGGIKKITFPQNFFGSLSPKSGSFSTTYLSHQVSMGKEKPVPKDRLCKIRSRLGCRCFLCWFRRSGLS